MEKRIVVFELPCDYTSVTGYVHVHVKDFFSIQKINSRSNCKTTFSPPGGKPAS